MFLEIKYLFIYVSLKPYKFQVFIGKKSEIEEKNILPCIFKKNISIQFKKYNIRTSVLDYSCQRTAEAGPISSAHLIPTTTCSLSNTQPCTHRILKSYWLQAGTCESTLYIYQ